MKFVRDKAHCKHELSVINNTDLKDIIESGYFILGDGISDSNVNSDGITITKFKGLLLLNSVQEITTQTSSEIYQVNQTIINGYFIYSRALQISKNTLSLVENAITPWDYKALTYMPTLDDIPQEIYTDGGPVYAGYKIDGYKVYVARHSFDFGDSNTCDISADYVTSNTILVKFEGVQNSAYQIPLDYTYISDVSKSFDATTIQCALDRTGQRIRLQANATGGEGWVDMYFYSQE